MYSTLPKKDFKGYTAVLASPSVGNVSQLCMDLMISSIKCSHLGMIWHEAVLPLVGANPYIESNSKLCSSNDVYVSDEHKLLLIQLRAPVQRAYVVEYLNNLLKYLQEAKVEDLIVLSGLFSHQRDDNEISRGPFRYATCPISNKKFGGKLESFGWQCMTGNNAENDYECPQLNGGGLTRTAFNIARKLNISCTGLFLYCSEGDNRQDAIDMMNNINLLLKFLPEDISAHIVYPPSWKFLFGNSVPGDIY